ncbi:hypothetical protein ACFLX9_02440 [Chloroflexota bacterium]
MKKRLMSLVGLTLALAVTSACASAAPTPTPTPSPTLTPTPTPTPEPGIDTLTEDNFRVLLPVEDVEGVLFADVPVNTEFFYYKEMAASVDPAQVVNMDRWYGLSFQTEDDKKGMTFTVIDFDSQSSAQDHFEVVKNETPGLESMESPIGDASVEVEVNAQGVGSFVVVIQGDKFVQLHTAQPEGQEPLLSLKRLEELAGLVASRL